MVLEKWYKIERERQIEVDGQTDRKKKKYDDGNPYARPILL
jgi:hypothetical protein